MLKSLFGSNRAATAFYPMWARPFVGGLFLWVAFLVAIPMGVAVADTADNKYLSVFGMIEQADALVEKGQTNLAKGKYAEAQVALWKLKQEYPNWNSKVVAFRLNYLNGQIVALSAPAASQPEAEAVTPSSSLPPGLQLRMLAAGSEPRRVLRFQPVVGQREELSMTLNTGMSMGGGEAQSAMINMPAMKFLLGLQPKELTASGDIHYEMQIEEVEVLAAADSLPGAAETMRASLKGIKGLVFTGTMAVQGFNKKTDAKFPADADPQTRAAIESMKESFANSQFVLPQEAVGAGAKWEVKQKVKSQGMNIDQTATFTLDAVEGNILSIKSTLTQQAANQKIANPMMPQMKVDLSKLTGTGSTTMTVDLTKLQPVKAAINAATEISLGAGGDAQAPGMKLKTETKILMESK